MKDNQDIKNENTKMKTSQELVNNLKKICLKESNLNLTKLTESLQKLALTSNLINFIKEVFCLPDKEEDTNSKIKSIILILIYKYNSSFFSSPLDGVNFDELTFMKNYLKNSLPEIFKLKGEEFILNYLIILIFLLIMKYKYSLANYQFIEEILKIKSYFNNEHSSHEINLTKEFLNLFLNINWHNHFSKNLDFILKSTLISQYLFNILNNEQNFDEIGIKNFIDQIQNGNESNNTIKDKNNFLYEQNLSIIENKFFIFPRHQNLIKKISEIYSINNEQKLLFYGSSSCGKSTFSKIFTKDQIIIDIDETIEVNNLLGGYLINEFSEIIWQDGLLLKALKDNKDIIFRNMEKCGNELFFILKQIVEKNAFFLNIKQETINFPTMPKLIFIYNTANTTTNNNNNSSSMIESLAETNDLIFNFLISNTFPIKFQNYSDEEKILIALNDSELFKMVNDKLKLVEDILEVYFNITKKYKFNTRFRDVNLSDLIKFSSRIEKMLHEMNISNIPSNMFLSERNKMKIISTFIFMAFYTLEDFNLISQIANDFAVKFNFEANNFKNSIVNFNDMFSNSDSQNFIINFAKEKVSFDLLASKENNLNFYSYNNNSKFYTKLINCSIINSHRENVLLVGETGVGKTTMIQNLAKVMNTNLHVINLSQSSDISELFGGFKPIHPQIFLQKYFEKIVKIITTNFNTNNNKNFINTFYEAYKNKDTEYFIKFTLKSIEKIETKIKNGNNSNSNNINNNNIINTNLDENTENVISELNLIKTQLNKFKKAMKRGCYNAFTYMDGILLDALKKDEWILLDEINLANDDLLLKLSPILEGQDIFIVENEELKIYKRGPKFRIFGSMNPEYNIGKKRLPVNLRSQFSEIFVHEIKEFHDIKTFVKTYLSEISCDDRNISEIARFYMFIKEKQNKHEIQKQNFSKCNFSLRTLSRALITIKNAVKFYDIQTSISEALHMNFLSLLHDNSVLLVQNNFAMLKLDHNLNTSKTTNNIFLKSTSNPEFTNIYANLNNYFIKKEFINPDLIDKEIDNKFILTKTFKNHLNNLMRIITLSDYAVLLEGPTSVGKTSIVEYVGKKIGQKVLRINNNQNTEIEEYIGNYTTDSKGQFYFQEGFLVKAVKEGSWIILDEINLAPSEVLEALNRLLDDNRELFVSELNTTIKAHPNFKIFAAMNPSELYGGRKDLSEAFKNRFIHLYFDNIPEEDLEEIVEKRCKLPKSRVKIMVSIFNDLQKIRSTEKIFSKKEGFITIRDLLKWGSRAINSYDDLSYEGFFVIAEKIRNEEEKALVLKIIEKNIHKYFKNITIDFDEYFKNYVEELINTNQGGNNVSNLCLNKSTMRMITLIDKCLKNKEPVLLIGETGTGKTVVCEFLARLYNKEMVTINCHENIDTSDFLGSLRSVYGREEKFNQIKLLVKNIFNEIKNYFESTIVTSVTNITNITNITNENIVSFPSLLNLKEEFATYYEKYSSLEMITITFTKIEKIIKFLNKFSLVTSINIQLLELNNLLIDQHKLFEWMDGPLTTSMKKGNFLLIDEISLAQDSVLERMNSVFEADRVLVLSEKQSHCEIIFPDESFMVIASMNPSGDHGKRELSPALRSRFSEIYIDIANHKEINMLYEKGKSINHEVESGDSSNALSQINSENSKDDQNEKDDILTLINFKILNNKILQEKLNENMIKILSISIYHLMIWFNFYLIKNSSQIVKNLTLRDVDMIVDFFEANINKVNNNNNNNNNNNSNTNNIPSTITINTRLVIIITSPIEFISLYFHSIHMTLIDGIFLNESSKPEALIKLKNRIIQFLDHQINFMTVLLTNGNSHSIHYNENPLLNGRLIDDTIQFGICPFFILPKTNLAMNTKFVFHTENIKSNLLKILRGLTTLKPILIEGSPGVGKTTIIQNLAKKLGKKIYRINLSEHTDMIDLIGSEYPTDDSRDGITFKWVDGVFLKALINGDWIIIDEMNLASQSILEGLNSVLDYRKSLFVSELNKEFKCHKDFQIFATQNPVNQGGGRKFLPKSFLNRFIKIYLNDLTNEDYVEILHHLFPSVDLEVITSLTKFNSKCQSLIYEKYKLNMNEVGEFNLRTLSKILQVYDSDNTYMSDIKDLKNLEEIIKLLYISRIRRSEVRKEIRKNYREIFNKNNNNKNENKYGNNNNKDLTYSMNNNCNLVQNKIPFIENSTNKITSDTSMVKKYSDRISICVRNNFPVIITGNSGIGKKEIIRYLAKVSNNNLYEFCLNSSMDSTELLGNFDKINFSYHLKNLKEKISSLINDEMQNINTQSTSQVLNNEYLQLLNLVDFIYKKLSNLSPQFSENLNLLKEKLNSLNILHIFADDIKSLEKVAQYIQNDTFNFEWHDSTLVHCITNGHWIILDNVNTCSAAVLDRLNSLLDDDKQIYLNECGSSEGRVVKPHKNFRIFLVMNEKFGEVSRALKNRCVEIYFDKKILNVVTEKITLDVNSNSNSNSNSNNENDFDLKIDNKFLIISYNMPIINENDKNKKIKIRINTFTDLIKISQNENLFNYQTSFKLTTLFLSTMIFTGGNNYTIDIRLFKKFTSIFSYYYIKSNNSDLISSFNQTFNLINFSNNNNLEESRKILENVIRKIENYFDNENTVQLDKNNNTESLINYVNKLMLIFRYKLNLSLSSDNLILFDTIFKNQKFVTQFYKEFNTLISKNSFFREIIMTDDNDTDNAFLSNMKNKNKIDSNLILFNNLLLQSINDKTYSSMEVFSKLITDRDEFSSVSTNVRDIKLFVENVNKNQKFLNKFSDELFVFLIFAFLNKYNPNANANNTVYGENGVNILNNYFDKNEKFLSSKLQNLQSVININTTVSDFAIQNLKRKNFENKFKKLISANYEEKVGMIFNRINLLQPGKKVHQAIVISIVDFINKSIEDNNLIKYLQLNPETFLFILDSIIDKYTNKLNTTEEKEEKEKILVKREDINNPNTFKRMYKKLKHTLSSITKDQIVQLNNKLSLINFDINCNYSFEFDPITLLLTLQEKKHSVSQLNNFDSKILFNIPYSQLFEIRKEFLLKRENETNCNNNDNKYTSTVQLPYSPLMKMILLEFDLKSAKSFSDLLHIKHYHGFIEKVNEILSNEKLIIPVVSSKDDMKNIQTFIESLVNYSSYINDYSILNYNNTNCTNLAELNFFKKYNAKDSIENKLIQFSLLNTGNTSSEKLVTGLLQLIVLDEFSDKNSISKLLYISNDCESIVQHFQSDFKKLFFVPFYYFYAKLYSENIISNVKNILKVNKTKNKISTWSVTLQNMNCFILGEKLDFASTPEDIHHTTDNNKLQKLKKLQFIIEQSQNLANITIPDKITISKILGKDLFKIFFTILIANKEKLIIAEKLIYNTNTISENNSVYKSESDFRNKNSDLLTQYENFKNKLNKFEKESFRGENVNYDVFIKDLSGLIEKFFEVVENIKKTDNTDTLTPLLENVKISLNAIINRHILYFGDIILPFATCLFIFISSLSEYIKININTKLKSKNNSLAINYNSLLNNSDDSLFYNTLYRLPNNTQFNLNLITENIHTKLVEYLEVLQKAEDANFLASDNGLFILKEKLKLYEDINMKVLENTNAMDELSKAEKERLRIEECDKEIEENFPTYADEFKNYDQLELIDLTKNIHIDDFYGRGGKNKNGGKNITNNNKQNENLYYMYKILEKHIFENENVKADYASTNTDPISEIFSLNYFYTKLHSDLISGKKDAIKDKDTVYNSSDNVNNNLSDKISNILQTQFFFYKIKSTQDDHVTKVDIDNLDRVSANNKENYYNFYKDGNPKEMKLLYISLNKFLEKTSIYLKDYEDHPLLVLIVIIIFNLLQLNVNSTPLSKVLSGLDVLLTKLQEWETYASVRINSFKDEMKVLMMLIRRFRKIEILSWKSLLNSKLVEYEKKDCLLYFDYIIKILQMAETNSINSENIDETLDTLNMFIQNSTFSTFKFRVNCLKFLSSFLLNSANRNNSITYNALLNSLNNIFNYYNINFILNEKFGQYKTNALKEIETKIKDLTGIAKWDIKNYFNFRDNMKRNYKQLNKILKSFDGFCLTNVKDFFEFSRSEFVSKDFVMVKFKPSEEDLNPKNIFDSISYEVFSRLESLRSLSSEARNKVFKNKALIDLIKTLKGLGFSSVYKFYRDEVYGQFKKFDLDFITGKENILESEVVYKIKKSSAYIIKILEKINNFNVLDKIHDDLNNKYLETMKGLCFSSYFKCLSIFNNFEQIVLCYEKLIKITNQKSIQLSDEKFEVSYDKLKNVYNQINVVLNILHLSNYNLVFDSDDENRKFRDLLEKVNLINGNYNQFVEFNYFEDESNNERDRDRDRSILLDKDNILILKKFIVVLEGLVSNDIMKRIEDNYFLIKNDVKDQVKHLYSTFGELNLNEVEEDMDVDGDADGDAEGEVEKSTYNVLTSYISFILNKSIMENQILNPIQNQIMNFSEFNLKDIIEEGEGEEADKDINKINEDVVMNPESTENNQDDDTENIKIDKLLLKITNINSQYSSFTHSSSHDQQFYLKTTFNLSSSISEISELMYSTLKLTNIFISIFYNVSLNGFCTKQKSEKSSDQPTGVHEGGFGMADAEGVEDITKEIEDEEQLLGLKEDKMEEDTGENQKKDKADKNSGFEMKTDFKEDHKEELASEDEDEEEKKSMDEEDIEREKDDVDDAKENKMYDKDNEIEDEEGDEGNRRKEKVDITDKSVSMEKKQDNDNNYKAKEENKSKGNDRNVDKPENKENDDKKDKENENKDKEDKEDKDKQDNENENNENENNQESKKIDKLDVEKKEEADKDKDKEEEEEEGGKTEEDPIETPIEGGQEMNKGEEKKGEDAQDDLMGENPNGDPDADNKIEDDADMEDGDGDAAESDSELSNKQEHGEEIKEDIEEENLEEIFKSNPLATKTEDLGYNPISNNKGSGGNTAQQSKENKEGENKENKENENDNTNMEQLDSLDNYEELFDLNSMLNSVWKTRPAANLKNKKEVNKSVNQPDKKDNNNNDDMDNIDNANETELKDQKEGKGEEEVMNNFDFQNLNEEERNKENENNKDFDQGHADEMDNANDKKASGFNNNEKENIEREKNKNRNKEDRAESKFNDRKENITIDNNSEDKMTVDVPKENKDKENFLDMDEDLDNVNINEDEDEDRDNNNMQVENEYFNSKTDKEKTLNAIKMELDKDIEMDPNNLEEVMNTNDDNNNQIDKSEWIKQMENDLLIDFNNWIKSEASSTCLDLWNKLENVSINHINKLVEHLKIALEPNKQTKLRGNYKSGKRLNIKKIISFIASNYRNDKIWLRRTLPFERNYYVTLAIDDSLSMKEHNLGFFALESLVIVSTALNKAGIGKLSIVGIKEDMEIYHNHTEVFNREKGSYLLSKFKFDFSSRISHDVAMTNFMKNSMAMLENQIKSTQGNASQIVFIISDGRFNKDNVRSMCIEAKEKGFLYVFIILDKYGIENNNSILNMNSVRHVYKPDGDYDIEVKPYLDDFPFSYYVIVEDSSDLPEVIHTILVKWFTINSFQ